MAFVVHGQRFADVRIDSVIGQPALGFGRLLLEVELLIHERRQSEKPMLVDLGGELLVRGRHETLHHLGRLWPARPPVGLEVSGPSATITLEVELDHARVEALEKLRLGEDLTLEVVLRGRVQLGREAHLVASTQTHRLGHAAWESVLEQLGGEPRFPFGVAARSANDPLHS